MKMTLFAGDVIYIATGVSIDEIIVNYEDAGMKITCQTKMPSSEKHKGFIPMIDKDLLFQALADGTATAEDQKIAAAWIKNLHNLWMKKMVKTHAG